MKRLFSWIRIPSGVAGLLIATLWVTMTSVSAQIVVTETIPLGGSPVPMAMTPDGTKVYVAHSPVGLSVIDTTTKNVTFIYGNSNIQDIAISPNGLEVYSVNRLLGTVSVISVVTDTVVDTINLNFGLISDVVFTSDGSRAFVTEANNSGPHEVIIIDTTTRTVVDLFTVSDHLGPLVLIQDGQIAYVGLLVGPQPWTFETAVFDVNTKAVLSTIPDLWPTKVSVDETKFWGYHDTGNTTHTDDAVFEVDLTTNSIISSISVDPFPRGLIQDPVSGRWFVASTNTSKITVIDSAFSSIETTIAVGAGPGKIAITPDGLEAYVANSTDGTVSVVSLVADPKFVQTFNDPFPTNTDKFGSSIAINDNYIVIGNSHDDTNGTDVGQVHLFDALTGNLVRTFDDPTVTLEDRFGQSVAIDGNKVLIGAFAHDANGSNQSGQAHLFDATTGVLLRTFNDPGPTFNDRFGSAVAIDGNNVLIGAAGHDFQGTNVGRAYLFDANTGDLLRIFNDPTPTFADNFGVSVALDGNNALIGAGDDNTQGDNVGQAHLFNITTGALIWTFDDPTPTTMDIFGQSVAIDGNNILVGAGGDDTNGTDVGQVHLFDALTGNLVRTFDDPTPTINGRFGNGQNVSVVGNRVAIGAPGDGTDPGEVYVFNVFTGQLLENFVDPTPTGSDRFGATARLNGDLVLIGDIWDDTNGTDVGQAHLFSLNTAPTAVAGDPQSIRAGDTVFLDGGGSFDDNTATVNLEYDWNFVSVPGASTATIAGATTATPSFVADVEGTYVVGLVVTDDEGLSSASAEVQISSDNLAPVAVVGANQLVVIGNQVNLDGSASFDPEFDPITFGWVINDAPIGSTATLSGSDTATPSFVPDVPGTYEMLLVVSDFIGPGAPGTIEIVADTAEGVAETAIIEVEGDIEVLPPENVTNGGNQNALGNFLTQAIVAIQEGDIAEAISKLEQALERTDGCVLRGSADGNGPGRDWITDDPDCSAQIAAYNEISAAIEALSGI